MTMKKAWRGETAALYRGNPLIVTVHPHGVLEVHSKRHRDTVAVPLLAVFELGWKMEARRQLQEKEKGKS